MSVARHYTTGRIVEEIRAELDRLVEAQADLAADLVDARAVSTRADVVEVDDKICVVVEVPGVPAEDLGVTVSGKTLAVVGEKPASKPARVGARFLCLERQWGRFERVLELPASVNPRLGRARLERGVLTVEFPVLSDQRNQPYRLEIEDVDGGELE